MDEVATPVGHRRSVSQLESMLKCGEAYRLERIVRVPQLPAAWLTQGIAVHGAIEMWEKTWREAPIEAVIKWYDDLFDQTLQEQNAQEPNTSAWLTGGRKKPDKDIEDRFNLGRQQARDYITYALATANEWRILDLGGDTPAVEVPFDITLNGVRVIGYIDQMVEWLNGGQITPRDLKTGTKLPSSPRQLGVYRVAFDEVTGIDCQWGDFYMFKNNGPTAPYDLSRYTRERVGAWFERVDKMINEGLFIPNPGDGCRICSVEPYCDLKNDRAQVFEIEKAALAAA